MRRERGVAIRRLLAFGLDWLVVVLWGGVLFGAVMVATGGNPPQPANPWTAQGIGFLTMTAPVTLYFALCESSAMPWPSRPSSLVTEVFRRGCGAP